MARQGQAYVEILALLKVVDVRRPNGELLTTSTGAKVVAAVECLVLACSRAKGHAK
jgi:hypothetical protein